jgi:2-alkenal reductase
MKRNKSLVWVSLIVALALIGLTGCNTASLLSAGSTQLNAPAAAAAAPTATPQPSVAPSITSDALAALEGTLEQVYQNVSPSVVYIEVLEQQAPAIQFPGLMPGQQQPQRASGSGFVWDQEGHIVTNNHVVEGAQKIEVTFSDGTIVPATLVGANSDSDLAVLKVDVPAAQLRPVQVGDSTQVKVGELAVAIGNPFGLENTMTVGFISALGRSLPVGTQYGTGPSYTIPNVIQTDAPINPGNSGGVLVNDQGEFIGVTAAIASPVSASAGIGFAIPAAIVQKVVPALIQTGHYAIPWLGISGTSLTPDLAQAMNLETNQRGALVVDVTPNSPAAEAGLRSSDRTISVDSEQARVGGDVIVAIGGQPVEAFDDLVAYLFTSTEVGQQVTLTVLRDGREQSVAVTLGERPTQQPAQQAGSNLPTGKASQEVWLGITGVTLSPEIAQAMNLPADQQGVLIEGVSSGSPADKAGLHGGHDSVTIQGKQVQVGGDVIVAWESQQVTQFEQLRALVSASRPGQEVTLTILRSGAQTEVKVTLEARSNQ